MNISQLAQQLYTQGKQGLNTLDQRNNDFYKRLASGDPTAEREFANATMIPLTMGVGRAAPFVKNIARKGVSYTFEDLDTAIGIIRSKSAPVNDYLQAAKTIMSEAKMQMTPKEFVKYQRKPIEQIINKILPRVKNEEVGEGVIGAIKRIRL